MFDFVFPRFSIAVRILMNFADKEDICSDFSDIVPHTVTAFERLFLDEKSMQVNTLLSILLHHT